MNILYISNTDLVGGRFTGYYMQHSLDNSDNVEMAVWKKISQSSHVHLIPPNNVIMRFITEAIIKVSFRIGLDRLIGFGSWILPKCEYFKQADIVHLHLIHNSCNLSILSLPMLSRKKALVWTIHDSWAITGGCEHSFECDRWLDGCLPRCPHPRATSLFQHYMPYIHWRIKKSIYKRSKITLVVASQWMHDRISRSPLLSNLPCHRIPFGIDIDLFNPRSKIECLSRLGIPIHHKVIAFRDNGLKTDKFKGMHWLFEALKIYEPQESTTLLILENGKDFINLSTKYNVITTGWVDGEKMVDILSAADVFLMPSIQESFGLMAVEAMACGTPVIVFEGTALPSVIKSTNGCLAGGLAVPAKDSSALAEAIRLLMEDDDLRKKLGVQARHIAESEYSLELYVRRHINLYKKLIGHQNNGHSE
jgi:glycosyltransferase involved in cell wall biosynthesis